MENMNLTKIKIDMEPPYTRIDLWGQADTDDVVKIDTATSETSTLMGISNKVIKL